MSEYVVKKPNQGHERSDFASRRPLGHIINSSSRKMKMPHQFGYLSTVAVRRGIMMKKKGIYYTY